MGGRRNTHHGRRDTYLPTYGTYLPTMVYMPTYPPWVYPGVPVADCWVHRAPWAGSGPAGRLWALDFH